MILKEMAEGVSLDKIKESTECEFLVSPDLKTF
jgi:acyl CoA:acetate/3-ketoacid CoA transferase beta subunit